MKIITAVFFGAIVCSASLQAQTPCTGTPAANSIQPSAAFTLCSGSSATMGLANTYSTSGIVYSWQSSSTSTVGPWTPVNGANSRNYMTPPLTNTAYYLITITCTNSGQSISIPVTISVVPCYTPCAGTPSNSLTPSAQTLCAGSTMSLAFSQTYSLTTGNSFQWFSSSSVSGPFSQISGAGSMSYTAPTPGSTTYYQAVVTCSNGGQSFTTAPVAVHVVTCTSCFGAPSGNTIVGPSTVCAGSQATLTLAQTYTNSGITYQWQSSGTSSVGPFGPPLGSSNTLVTPTLQANTFYLVTITCTNSSQSTNAVHTVSVVSCPTACVGFPPSGSVSPASQTICAGASASMSVGNNYANISGLAFQWLVSGSQSGPFNPVTPPGGTSSAYVTGTLSGNAYYQAVITCTSVNAGYTTAVHPVTVVQCTNCFGAPGTNTILPVSPTICAGAQVTLSLANTYTAGGITYQWQSSTTSPVGPFNNISGAISSTYTTPALTGTVYYNVVITCTSSGQSISVSTGVYTIPCSTVCTGAPGGNTVVPLNHTVCIGDPAAMSLLLTYTAGGITYSWQQSAAEPGPYTSIPQATLASYTHPLTGGNLFFRVVITCTASGESLIVNHKVSAVDCNFPGIKEDKSTQARIFPNPVKNELLVELNRLRPVMVTIINVWGKETWKQEASAKEFSIPVSGLPAGIYILLIDSEGSLTALKFVKE
jgi:hypothetical protein